MIARLRLSFLSRAIRCKLVGSAIVYEKNARPYMKQLSQRSNGFLSSCRNYSPRSLMKPYTRNALHIPRTAARQWHRTYATERAPGSRLFESLRDEMLARKFPLRVEDYAVYDKPARLTLADALPAETLEDTVRLIGPSQLLFNAQVATGELLPDGTDALHSPGGAWVRRMWQGGSLKLDKVANENASPGFEKRYVCAERITDVHSSGSGQAAKMFVTIERRFKHAWSGQALKNALKRGWENSQAAMVEERVLIFMKEQPEEQRRQFKEGIFPEVKYARRRFVRPSLAASVEQRLKPQAALDESDFSHKVTPTPALLFRWSALTWNAHAIHLDPGYARTVEGHRNLLVHGPLTLVLMLGHMTNYLKSLGGPPQTIRAIEYRNLAPLYAHEELQLCARMRSLDEGRREAIYDVWIEGPTGGMAVKATVRTSAVPIRKVQTSHFAIRKMETGKNPIRKMETGKNRKISTRKLLVRRVPTSTLPIRKISIRKHRIRNISTRKLLVRGVPTSTLPIRKISTRKYPTRTQRRYLRFKALLQRDGRSVTRRVRLVRAPPSPVKSKLTPIQGVLARNFVPQFSSPKTKYISPVRYYKATGAKKGGDDGHGTAGDDLAVGTSRYERRKTKIIVTQPAARKVGPAAGRRRGGGPVI